MKRTIVLISVLLMVLAVSISAQSISTQGVLRDSDGHSVEDGDYTMAFSIYSALDGGTLLWGPYSKTVAVENGVYQVVLGDVNPITSFNSDGSNYLEITVENEIMTPRLRLNVTPYELANLSGSSNVFPGSGNTGIGTTSPQAKLSIVAPGDNVDLIHLDENGDADKEFTFQGMFAGSGSSGNGLKLRSQWIDKIMFWRGDGNVGIGTDAPGGKLTVKGGNLYVDNNNFGGTPAVDIAVGDTDTGLDSDGDGALDIYSNNNKTMSIRSGKVGIGTSTPVIKLQVEGGSDVSPSSGGFIQAGASSGANIAIDNNEIMARNNGEPAMLHLNNDGGITGFGGSVNARVGGGGFSKPFQFVKFEASGENATINTGWSADDWIAAITGFDAGYGDLDESGNNDLWQINAFVENGVWKIFCDAPTHNNYPEWDIYVMFVNTKFGYATAGYKAN
ncbi:MAG: hypothetical protein U9Q77_13735 [Candidatus Marinimicrobia bacterium]|nr:hypothetical protein [Candidatus Neomarinimicrobiota bacterium]